MMILWKALTTWLVAVLITATSAFAEMSWNEGVVSHRRLPAPLITKTHVRLDVPHMRQGVNLCVPTSTAMVLRYFGDEVSPRDLKARAEGYKPAHKRNADFTYWQDVSHALREMGYRWKIENYARTKAGFRQGLKAMQRHLRKGLPVLIDVHMGPGHTFVVTGFDDASEVIYVRDPDLPKARSRKISYASLEANWHNHRFGPNRGAFYAYRKR